MQTATPEPVDVLIVPTQDAHQSEYTAECDNRRAWLSGFTGSAGCAVVTQKKAALFTDGRYYLQASQELDNQEWTLMKQGLAGVPTWQEFVSDLPNARIGVDPSVTTIDEAKKLQDALVTRGSTLVALTNNLVDSIRDDTRPPRPTNPIHVHDIQYAGKTHNTKLTELMADVAARGYGGTVVSALDEIAWLLNLRGSDIHCCPVFFAYCVVTPEKTFLYVKDNSEGNRLHPLEEYLSLANVSIRDYDQLASDLSQMKNNGKKWLVDPQTTNLSVAQALGDCIEFGTSMIPLAKAIKNPIELASTSMCHQRDGATVTQHFAWLAHELDNSVTLREYDAVQHLEAMRQQHKEYVGLAFDTIAATGAHGAIIHYQPSPTDSAIIDPRQLYLCDSGAQYKDGTTDITRTFLFSGQPTDFQKRAFTRVLQAHIALDQAIFPTKTTGYQLDTIARQALWRDGLNYRHGTGHGVGAYLNVHEGPHSISQYSFNKTPLQENMLVTNEPGYYQDGEFGIRIENVLMVCQASTPYCFDGSYLGFKHLTFVPLGKKLIDTGLLNNNEIEWINNYHLECRHILEPLLQSDRQTLVWLEDETEPLLVQ
ncbi:Creatinase aminopeptidase [Chlamydoabsidia padenii]|nr:Creatinase aminopeptidase [Chlamydoabsidia padenii]